MTEILVLGATGRTGAAFLKHRPENIHLHAGVRLRCDAPPPPTLKDADDVRIVDLADPTRMQAALIDIDIVVNAIRLRDKIPVTALIDLHTQIVKAQDKSKPPLIIHVGGAGAIHLNNGRRFWQNAEFPKTTLPRGIAHAALRDFLESQVNTYQWAYLIPPPQYLPKGAATGTYRRMSPSRDEHAFLQTSISYEDFALALADAIKYRWSGTSLISN